MFETVRRWLKNSPRVHFDHTRPSTLEELVELLDRFLDGKLNYELEWDDFISWKNNNSNIENVRLHIADMEPLFFSKQPTDRNRAVELLVEDRNRAAALIGRCARKSPLDEK